MIQLKKIIEFFASHEEWRFKYELNPSELESLFIERLKECPHHIEYFMPEVIHLSSNFKFYLLSKSTNIVILFYFKPGQINGLVLNSYFGKGERVKIEDLFLSLKSLSLENTVIDMVSCEEPYEIGSILEIETIARLDYVISTEKYTSAMENEKFKKSINYLVDRGFKTTSKILTPLELKSNFDMLLQFSKYKEFEKLIPVGIEKALSNKEDYSFILSKTQHKLQTEEAVAIYLIYGDRALQLWQFDNRYEISFGKKALIRFNLYNSIKDLKTNYGIKLINLGHIGEKNEKITTEKKYYEGNQVEYQLVKVKL